METVSEIYHHLIYQHIILVSSIVTDRMKPISIISFRDHVQQMHSEQDRGFESEYQVLNSYHKQIYDILTATIFWLSVPGVKTHSFPWCCKATFQQNEEPVCQHLPMYVFDLLYVVNMHACPCFHCKLNHTLCLTATAYDDIIFFAYRIFILMKTYYINLQFTILRLHNSLLPL